MRPHSLARGKSGSGSERKTRVECTSETVEIRWGLKIEPHPSASNLRHVAEALRGVPENLRKLLGSTSRIWRSGS